MDKVETMVFVNEGSGNEAITLRDREISDYSVSVGAHTWGWGDTFSTCQIAFTLKALHPWGMFRKLFVRLFIAVAVALLSFFIPPAGIDPRFGLLVGSLFAAIANQYVVTSSLPLAGTESLADTIHQLSYFFILLCLGLTLLSLKCVRTGREKLSQGIDKVGLSSFTDSIRYP